MISILPFSVRAASLSMHQQWSHYCINEIHVLFLSERGTIQECRKRHQKIDYIGLFFFVINLTIRHLPIKILPVKILPVKPLSYNLTHWVSMHLGSSNCENFLFTQNASSKCLHKVSIHNFMLNEKFTTKYIVEGKANKSSLLTCF